MKATFENSVDVLVRAYMNDTLEATACEACAVGNLVAAASGYTVVLHDRRFIFGEGWLKDGKPVKERPTWFAYHSEKAAEQFDRIGYTKEQVMAIEHAFMACGDGIEVDNFDALIRVVDVLAEIHGVDLSVKESAIGQFKEVQLQKA